MISHKGWNNPLSYLISFVVTLLVGCAPALRPPAGPFSPAQTAQLISHLREQGEEVESFQAVGKVRFKGKGGQSESDLFAVGRRPFKVRLEITHPWGKPLSHIVVDEENISVLSLTDSKFFRGPASPANTERLFLFRLDLDSAWKILSGRVPILPHCRAVSLRPDEIILYNCQGEVVEIISFFHGTALPKEVSLPRKWTTIALSEFKEGDLGPYPSTIRVEKGDKAYSLEIRYKGLKLNRSVPDEVFQLNPPPGFEVITLDDHGTWSLPDF